MLASHAFGLKQRLHARTRVCAHSPVLQGCALSAVIRAAVSSGGELSNPEKILSVSGPNGIERVGNLLILGLFSDYAFYRYDTTTGIGSPIRLSPPVGISADGIFFDEDHTYLYVADNKQSRVHVLASYDEWFTAELIRSIDVDPATCNYPTSVIVWNDTLFVTCAHGFAAAGTYSVAALGGLSAQFPRVPLQGPEPRLVATIEMPGWFGEGLEIDYSNNRLVLGGFGNGRIIGIPMPRLADPPMNYTASSAGVHTYYAGNSSSSFSAIGLQVDPNDACIMYSAAGLFRTAFAPTAGPGGGVSSYNLCTNSLIAFTDLTALSPVFMNDLTVMGDIVWATDFLGNKIYSIMGQNSGTPFARTAFGLPGGPNGIEFVGDVLIVSQITAKRFFRYDTATRLGQEIVVTPPNFASGDGIIFDSSRTYLFTMNYPMEQISVLVSLDHWHTAKVIMQLKASCGLHGPPTAVALLNDDVLFYYCGGGFVPGGPFEIRAIEHLQATLPPLRQAMLQQVHSPTASELVSAFNALIGAWTRGDRGTWSSATKDTTRMVIPAIGMDAIGAEAQWSVRQHVATAFAGVGPDEPLSWVNTVDSHIVDTTSRTVRCYMKSVTLANGTLIVVGDWMATFDSNIKATWIHQQMQFAPLVGVGSSLATGTGPQTGAYASAEDTKSDEDVAAARGMSIAALVVSVLAILLVAVPTMVASISRRTGAKPFSPPGGVSVNPIVKYTQDSNILG